MDGVSMFDTEVGERLERGTATSDAMRIILQSFPLGLLALATRTKIPRSYASAAPRRKALGVRRRKSAVYASLPGIRRIRIRLPNQYVRRAN
jgi:alpha-D-ribose 1-methylphosphonate 5-triphosphate synthase subunit PhnI